MEDRFITGRLVDCTERSIYPVRLTIRGQMVSAIDSIAESELHPGSPFISPGFVDAHIHIESSMLVPVEFARLAVVHGTIATVSDPHEIANVCGVEGIRFMIANGKKVPFRFYFGAPSCVPATGYETAGARLDASDVADLLADPDIWYLSEMMNFPGALAGDADILAKIEAARRHQKPVDGHAPGLRGEAATAYAALGISTDHECVSEAEARDKLAAGMKILIREGSAARNFDALIGLLGEYPDRIMFCSDDKHPDSLVVGHINRLCARAVAAGFSLFDVIRAATLNPILHYGLDIGRLRPGDPADFILLNDLVEFSVKETWVRGNCVARDGKTLIPKSGDANEIPINKFHARRREEADFIVPAGSSTIYPLPVIGARNGQLITEKELVQPRRHGNAWVSDVENDVLKLVVINRYADAPIAKAFVRGMGLRQGAIASTVAHDSHNLVATGVDDESLMRATNLLVQSRGGICCVKDNFEMVLPLPVAGLMTFDDGYRTAELYTLIDRAAREAGSPLDAPFMTLSFLALLVIPHLKISDLGLFDCDRFQLLPGP